MQQAIEVAGTVVVAALIVLTGLLSYRAGRIQAYWELALAAARRAPAPDMAVELEGTHVCTLDAEPVTKRDVRADV